MAGERKTGGASELLKDVLLVLLGVFLSLGGQLLLTISVSSTEVEVQSLISQEATAGLTHDGDLAARLFMPNATIEDSGCVSHASPQFWQGTAQIRDRYAHLPAIAILHHASATTTLNNMVIGWFADHATARSATVGVETLTDGAAPIALAGYEDWTFDKRDGTWRIASLTFNQCA